MNEKRIKNITKFISAFLIERTGNDTFDEWYEKRKISKILKEDSKNIEKYFYTYKSADLYNLVEEYMMYNVFKEANFYSSKKLNEEQENRLWDDFSNYMRRENLSNYIDNAFKEKIIRCVNLHNEAISTIILDARSRFRMQTAEKQHEYIKRQLKQMEENINTLNLNTRTQDHDEKLDFFIEQMESIMKSYRYDINQLRRRIKFIFCCLFFIITVLFTYLVLNYNNITDQMIWIIILVLNIICILIHYFVRFRNGRLYHLEEELDEMRRSVWKLHYSLYENQITNKYNKIKNEEKSED